MRGLARIVNIIITDVIIPKLFRPQNLGGSLLKIECCIDGLDLSLKKALRNHVKKIDLNTI